MQMMAVGEGVSCKKKEGALAFASRAEEELSRSCPEMERRACTTRGQSSLGAKPSTASEEARERVESHELAPPCSRRKGVWKNAAGSSR